MSQRILRWKPEAEAAIVHAKKKTGIDVPLSLVLAVIEAESGGNPKARSPAGAIGLMQLMPATARGLGVDPTVSERNVLGGTLYLAQQIKKFGILDFAVAAYNAGPGNVRKYKGVPPFKETQAYVVKVKRLESKYKKELEK